MENRYFKIGQNQDKNLKWLLNQIFYNAQCGRRGYIVASSLTNYADIFEMYNDIYHTVCPAAIYSDKVELTDSDILYVHDLFGNFHCNILHVIKDVASSCKALYITAIGNNVEE